LVGCELVVRFDVRRGDETAVTPGEREQCLLRLFVRHQLDCSRGASRQVWVSGCRKPHEPTRTDAMIDLASPVVELVGFALIVLLGVLLTARH
jgi:hypothetical protein